MAIIMRSSGQKRDQGDNRKQIYTWVGCGLVMVLTLVSVIPNMGSEPKAPDYSKFSSSKQQDLAAMPFGTDSDAVSFLNGNPEYGEVASNAQLLDSLFSSEERKERHEKDVAEGVPPPPDPEYKEIAREKERVAENKRIEAERKQKNEANAKRIAAEQQRIKSGGKNQVIRKNNETTKPSTLNPGGNKGNFGGGGGTSVGVTWNYADKNIKTGQGNTMPTSHNLTAQDAAFSQKYGRNVGLDVAAIKSAQGAKADDSEKAAHDALEAFQGEVKPEDLEEAKDELDLGDELPTIDPNLQDELKRAINDDVKNQQDSTNKSSNTAKGKECGVNDNCFNSCTNKVVWRGCLWSKFLSNLLDKGMDCVMEGCWTNWFGSAKKSSNSNIVDHVGPWNGTDGNGNYYA